MTKQLLTRRNFAIGAAGASTLACVPVGTGYAEIDALSRNTKEQLFSSYPVARAVANRSAGYIVFPQIAKAGLMLGGSHGKGSLFVGDNIVGHYSVSAISYGLQAGIQSFSMMLFFMTSEALAHFRQSLGFEIGTDVEYALPNAGLSIGASSATYQKPVYALIFNQTGVMAGASLEGAKYSSF